MSITNEQKQESYDYTLQEVKAKEPKCTEAGNKAYYKCSVCGKLYTDQEGTNEVSANTVVVPAKGHSFTWIIDREATEQAEGSRHEECSICHEKKAAIQYTAERIAKPEAKRIAKPEAK